MTVVWVAPESITSAVERPFAKLQTIDRERYDVQDIVLSLNTCRHTMIACKMRRVDDGIDLVHITPNLALFSYTRYNVALYSVYPVLLFF